MNFTLHFNFNQQSHNIDAKLNPKKNYNNRNLPVAWIIFYASQLHGFRTSIVHPLVRIIENFHDFRSNRSRQHRFDIPYMHTCTVRASCIFNTVGSDPPPLPLPTGCGSYSRGNRACSSVRALSRIDRASDRHGNIVCGNRDRERPESGKARV